MSDDKPYVRRISPSQLELFGRCQRRWAFVHRAKRKEPFTGAAQAGTEVHKILEEGGPWDREWTAPDTGKTYPVGQMAALLQAQTPEGVVAREKRHEFELEGLPFVCITDFLSEEVVGDYKTTSRIKNAKSKAKLLEDPQRLLNSAVVPTATKTTWLYGAWDTMLVAARECDIDREADKKRLHLKVLQPAEVMLNTPDSVDPLSMKPNVNDCALFPPVGCEFKNECFPPGKLAPVVRESKESSKQMASLIDQIKKKAAEKSGAPAEANKVEETAKAEVDQSQLYQKRPLPDGRIAYTNERIEEKKAAAPEPVALPAAPEALKAALDEAREGVAAVSGSNTAARSAEPGPQPEPPAGSPTPLPPADGKLIDTLYVDCIPLDESFVNAATLVAAAAEEAAGDLHVPHILLAEYGKGGPALAAQLRAHLSGQYFERLYLETRSAEGKACLNMLMSVARRTIKGCF